MKNKKFLSILFALLILISTAFSAFALNDIPRLTDSADLLTSSEEAVLLSKLDEISEKHQADIVIVTVDSLDGKTPTEYADDFFDYNGFGFGENKDGVLFLLSMEERDWWISTSGFGITALTDAGIEYISNEFLPELSRGNYFDAFAIFAEQCDDYFTQAESGEPYDSNLLPPGVDGEYSNDGTVQKLPFDYGSKIMISLIIGFVIALIITLVMAGQLKSVRFQPSANSYIKQNSMKVTDSRDIFLYTHTDRRAIPKPPPDSGSHGGSGGGSSIHVSSSGSTHGGGGGKF